MRVWMYEMIYKEIEGVGSFYVDDLSDGVLESFSRKRPTGTRARRS